MWGSSERGPGYETKGTDRTVLRLHRTVRYSTVQYSTVRVHSK